MSVIEMLNCLAEMRSELDGLRTEQNELIDAVLTRKQHQEIEDIKREFSEKISSAEEDQKKLEGEIKLAVINEGASVKGAYLHAVYTKGKQAWDGKGLSGYAVAHPEVWEFATIGDPNVSIRPSK